MEDQAEEEDFGSALDMIAFARSPCQDSPLDAGSDDDFGAALAQLACQSNAASSADVIVACAPSAPKQTSYPPPFSLRLARRPNACPVLPASVKQQASASLTFLRSYLHVLIEHIRQFIM